MVDHASYFMFNFTQTSAEASQTPQAEHEFETFDKSCGVTIQHYYADNKIFNSQQLKEKITSAPKIQSFFGVNAHNQNGVT